MTVLIADLESELLLRLGTATIYEASGIDCFLPSRIKPVWLGSVIVGRAFPVKTAPADNLSVHLALEQVRPGDVLVVDGNDEDCGYWGDVLTVAAKALGVAGLVIDGGVRDTAALEELAFPVFSSRVSITGTLKDDPGAIGQPIQIGRASVRLGDVVVADRDGVVVVPAESFARVVEASLEREEKEFAFKQRLRAGEHTMDLYGFPRP